MCLQCFTEASVVAQDILPGYTLMRAEKHNKRWPKGWYGLVRSNDPDVVFAGPLVADPFFGLTDDEMPTMAATPGAADTAAGQGEPMPPEDAAIQAYHAAAQTLETALNALTIDLSIPLVKACVAKGYDNENDGRLAFWLIHQLASSELHPPQPE